MRTFVRLCVLCVPLLLLAACEPPQDVEKEMAALEERNTQFVEAFESEDVDALMDIFWNSPDLVVYPPPTLEARGYDGVRQLYADLFEANDVIDLEVKNEGRRVSGNMAHAWGTYTFTFQPSGGDEKQSEGRYTAMFMKHDGEWHIVVDHISVPLPSPSAMEKK